MATEVVDSKPSAATAEPALYRFSVEQYHGMIESGILSQDDRVQMLEGAIVEMTPIGPRHRVSVTRLNDLLAKMLPKDWNIACQQPIT